MKNDSDEDALVRELAPLSPLDVGPAAEGRTRARCHALLARRRRKAVGAGFVAGVLGRLWTFLEPALVSALAVFYLGGAIEKAFLVFSR
ncbi:MAG: hypothetical protein HY900_05380 [Deltaproteobacteria bacterium]|nr:hypothetical protein [Deltaproteobacteria bacterium]